MNPSFFFFFFDNRGCPSQLTRISTNFTRPWSKQPGKYTNTPKGTRTCNHWVPNHRALHHMSYPLRVKTLTLNILFMNSSSINNVPFMNYAVGNLIGFDCRCL